MDFDFNKTLELIKGGLFKPEATWNEWLAQDPPWLKTLTVLTAPLLVANVLLSVILWKIMGGYAAFGLGGGLVEMLVRGLLIAAVGLAVAVFAFHFLAGVFKGKPDFSRAFAAVSLAAVPAWVAGVVGAAIPWFGGLVALAGGVWSLVLLYKVMPLALGVPEDKRVLHYVTSLVAILVANMVIGAALGAGAMRREFDEGAFSTRTASDSAGAGIFGSIQRQAALIESAQSDRFEAPPDGEVSESQVRDLVKVLEKTQALREEQAQKLEKLEAELEDEDEASPADLAALYKGMGGAINMANAEMEIVKTAGGNWAEHSWVKEQLRIARIQRGEGSSAIEHNYKLYQEYEDQLGD